MLLEEPLLLRPAYRMTRKSGHYPQDYGRNRCKNVEPFFTSLADFIRVQLLWHIRKAGSMGFARNEEINSFCCTLSAENSMLPRKCMKLL